MSRSDGFCISLPTQICFGIVAFYSHVVGQPLSFHRVRWQHDEVKRHFDTCLILFAIAHSPLGIVSG